MKKLSALLLLTDQRQLIFRRCFRQKIVHSGFGGHEQCGDAVACGVMGVEMDWNRDFVLERLDERVNHPLARGGRRRGEASEQSDRLGLVGRPPTLYWGEPERQFKT